MLANVKEEVNELEITERTGILKLRRVIERERVIANWFPKLYKEKTYHSTKTPFVTFTIVKFLVLTTAVLRTNKCSKREKIYIRKSEQSFVYSLVTAWENREVFRGVERGNSYVGGARDARSIINQE